MTSPHPDDTPRWLGHSHQEILAMVAAGGGSQAAQFAEGRWHATWFGIMTVEAALTRAIADVGSGWEGEAASATTSSVTPLGRWALAGAEQALSTSQTLGAQARYAEHTRREMPPEPFPGLVQSPGTITPPDMMADWQREDVARDEAAARARDLMQTYTYNSYDTLPGMLEPPPPPTVVIGTGAAGGGASGGGVSAFSAGGFAPPTGAGVGAAPAGLGAGDAALSGGGGGTGAGGVSAGGSGAVGASGVGPGGTATGGAAAGGAGAAGVGQGGVGASGGIGASGNPAGILPVGGGAGAVGRDRPRPVTRTPGAGGISPAVTGPGTRTPGPARRPPLPSAPSRDLSGPDLWGPSATGRGPSSSWPPIGPGPGGPGPGGTDHPNATPGRGAAPPVPPRPDGGERVFPSSAPADRTAARTSSAHPGMLPMSAGPAGGGDREHRRPPYLVDDGSAFADDRWIPPHVINEEDGSG